MDKETDNFNAVFEGDGEIYQLIFACLALDEVSS